ILRNLLRAADLLPTGYALGVVTMCFDSRFRRLGDLAAGTVVVSEPRTRLATTRTSSAHVEIAGLVQRPRLSAEERAALALFARRRPHLSPARVEELAALLAPSMRRRFGVPEAPDVALLEALHPRSSLS